LQPYLFSINKYLQDHALPPVALGPLVSGDHKELANCKEDMAPLPQQLPLPATVSLEILELAENLHLSVPFLWMDPDMDLLRVAYATITAYMFFNRGECGACVLRGDIVVGSNFVTLILRREKGKNALGVKLLNVRHIPCDETPRFAALLRVFFAGYHSMEGRQRKRLRRLPLGPSEDTTLWSVDTLSE